MVIRGIVSPELTAAARARIDEETGGQTNDPNYNGPINTGRMGPMRASDAMTNLVNGSGLTPLLHEALGDFDPVATCSFRLNQVEQKPPGSGFSAVGYRGSDSPYLGAGPGLHIDGSCTIGVPHDKVWEGSPQEIYDEYINSGSRGALGKSPDVIGDNSVPLFEDKEMTLGLGSFSAFAIVALNDQSLPGRGQTVVLPGAHLVAEKFFRWQREVGDGMMAIEGPGWPRLYHDCPNRCGLNCAPPRIPRSGAAARTTSSSFCCADMPDKVRNAFIDESSETTPDGRRWPRPSPVLMEEGDAAFTVFHCPSAPTPSAPAALLEASRGLTTGSRASWRTGIPSAGTWSGRTRGRTRSSASAPRRTTRTARSPSTASPTTPIAARQASGWTTRRGRWTPSLAASICSQSRGRSGRVRCLSPAAGSGGHALEASADAPLLLRTRHGGGRGAGAGQGLPRQGARRGRAELCACARHRGGRGRPLGEAVASTRQATHAGGGDM